MIDPLADWYSRFSTLEARGNSAIYEGYTAAIATDAEVLDRIRELPEQKRQPNLVLASARLLGAPLIGYPGWRSWLLEHWSEVVAVARVRSTQTNEPARCSVLLPLLARTPRPIALIEVGASAGLCLQPDRYSYLYDGDHRVDPIAGPSAVVLEAATTGPVPFPQRMPEIVWRAGLDLNPLPVEDPAAMEWLETLIWPEQVDRLARIRAAAEIARREPFTVERGDLVDDLPDLVSRAPAGAEVVVMHTAVLPYVPRARREEFFELVESLDVRWIACEPWAALHWLPARQQHPATHFVLAEDREPRAFADAHGRTLDWL